MCLVRADRVKIATVLPLCTVGPISFLLATFTKRKSFYSIMSDRPQDFSEITNEVWQNSAQSLMTQKDKHELCSRLASD